jgi:UDP-glucose 4-epimerase
MPKIIIVTGASGYIGGQTALQLKDAGHTVIGIDRQPLPRHLEGVMNFLQADFDSDVAKKLLLTHCPDAIIHCAGTSLVGPSMTQPGEYYKNNAVKTVHLLDFILQAMPKTKFIFSSSAATYGDPIMVPCHEVDPTEPISPYGESKLMVEWILRGYHRAYGLNYVAFRYFNACGADSQARHGQSPGATHIIARVLEAIRDGREFVLNGEDYPTTDGTCVRDYVHVEDIVASHIRAIDSEIAGGVYNLGTQTGISNREIISAAEEITGRKLSVTIGPRREGDPAMLTATPTKWYDAGGNRPKHTLQDMITHAWQWYNR